MKPLLFEKLTILIVCLLPFYFSQMGAISLVGLQPIVAELNYLKIDSFVSKSSSVSRGRYQRAELKYSYLVSGISYEGSNLYASHNTSRDWLPFDSDISDIRLAAEERKLIAYFDPKNPKFSVLKRRFDPIGLVVHALALLFLYGFLFAKKRALVVGNNKKATFVKTDQSLYDVWRNKRNSK